eukprot:SAG11_NODE_33055_length_279_cov_0.855556_1_plen_32_part_01
MMGGPPRGPWRGYRGNLLTVVVHAITTWALLL